MADLQLFTNSSVDMPSTSTNFPNHYHDVFINHRGPDVKETFATRLYHRLLSHTFQPFLDKVELQKGEYIDSQIEGAIRTASIHIVIFSPRYAESKWCLDELLLILNKSGDTILPIFYNVEISEVRWTKERYAKALSDHELKGRYDHQTLENWRIALNKVSLINGFELKAYNGDEDKLLDDVVECVLKKRRNIPLHVADCPTGLHLKVEEFERTVLWRQQKTDKAWVLGIIGLGGVGKTTLAKELFNRKRSDFNKSSFLYDVRETVRLSSLNSLQSTLLKDLTQRTEQIDSIEKGIEILREHLSSSHALIILDDVDDAYQLHAFLPVANVLHSDSLIVVTSRNKNVLTSSGIAETSIYQLTGLNDQYSRQLLCSHAFLQPHPLVGFENLVDEFCKACDGLPLSLRVFGALLCGKSDQSYWKCQLDKLSETELPDDILKRLKISYDALDKEEERQIFLDIACYFIGEDRDMAVRIWDGSGWHGLVGFRNLQDKCLVDVGENNTIKMHDHLRDLGRQIADQQKSSGVIPHRLWRVMNDIPELWQNSSVMTEMGGVRTVRRLKRYKDLFNSCGLFSKNEQVITGARGVRTVARLKCDEGSQSLKLRRPSPYLLSKLQLVVTEDYDLECILRKVKAPNLIWLRWSDCPYNCLPPWLLMKNVRVLEVRGNKLNSLWTAKSQAPLELRELTIHSPVSPLFEFPKSIGQLKHIEKIVVLSSNLKLLPKEFGDIHSLKYLDLSFSERLQMLPDSFGKLTNLQHLALSHSGLQMLPNSFGGLTNLLFLDLNNSHSLQMLPNSFGNLIRLKYLNLLECPKLTILDETFANIRSLEYLGFICREKVPRQVAHQQSLEEFYMSSTSLQELPEDIGNLSSLEVFEVGNCPSLKKLPCSLGYLSRLKHLRLLHCKELKSLPDSLGLLTQLSKLLIQECGIESLPAEVVKLNNLVKLTILDCPIRELPVKKGVEGESSTIELSRLEFLELMATKLSEISFVEGVCPSLKHLLVKKCNDLVEVGALPPTLIKLSLCRCEKLRKMEGFSNLTNLQELDIYSCKEVEELPCLEMLTSLKKFRAYWCLKLKRIGGLGHLTQLEEVSVLECDALEEIEGVEDLLRRLKKLYVAQCPQLRSGVEEQLHQRYRESVKALLAIKGSYANDVENQ